VLSLGKFLLRYRHGPLSCGSCVDATGMLDVPLHKIDVLRHNEFVSRDSSNGDFVDFSIFEGSLGFQTPKRLSKG